MLQSIIDSSVRVRVPWLPSIKSESITGLSSIEMFFAPGTDLLKARQMVQERMVQAHALPNVSSPPILLQPVASASLWLSTSALALDSAGFPA